MEQSVIEIQARQLDEMRRECEEGVWQDSVIEMRPESDKAAPCDRISRQALVLAGVQWARRYMGLDPTDLPQCEIRKQNLPPVCRYWGRASYLCTKVVY